MLLNENEVIINESAKFANLFNFYSIESVIESLELFSWAPDSYE